MWNKHRYAILSLVLVVGIFLTGIRLPFVARAEGASTPADPAAIQEKTIEFMQDGTVIGNSSRIDLYKEITVNLTVKVNLDQADDKKITKNNFIEYELGSPFKFAGDKENQTVIEEITKAVTLNKNIAKTTITKDNDGKIKVKFDFSAADDAVFNERDAVIKATVKLKVDVDKIDHSNPSSGKVSILNQDYAVEGIQEELNVGKKGKVDWSDATVLWTVDMERKLKGSTNTGLTLAGSKFIDELKETGEYVTDSLQVNGHAVTPDVTPTAEDKKISYVIKDSDFGSGADKSKATVTFKTKITSDDLKNGKEYTNTAKVEGLQKSKESNIATAGVIKFGKKTGTVTNAAVNYWQIKWAIEFNEEAANLGPVKIKDELQKDFFRGTATQTSVKAWYEEWYGEKWVKGGDVTPSSIEYTISNVTKKTRLIIQTNTNIPANNVEYFRFKNTASISWGTGTDPKVSFDGEVALGKNWISKTVKPLDEKDPDKKVGFETEWIATYSKKEHDSGTYYLYDAFIFDNDILTRNSVIKDDDYKITEKGTNTAVTNAPLLKEIIPGTNWHQRLINADDPNKVLTAATPGSLSVKVLEIKRKADNKLVGHLLKISNFGDGTSQVSFKTKMLEPEHLLKKEAHGYNYMSLVKDGKKVDEAESWPRYNSRMIKKQALSKDAARQFLSDSDIGNADVISEEQSKDNYLTAYDRDSKTITYRLSVNAANVHDEDGDLGNIIVSDKLNEYWEYVDIQPGKKFLLYKGETAFKGAATDAAVRAVGSELSGSIANDKFTNNVSDGEAEFKFNKIDSPYVIFLKVQLKESSRNKYLNYYGDVNNTAKLTIEKMTWDSAIVRKKIFTESDQKVKVDERFLWKDVDLAKSFDNQTEEGVVKWTVLYKPYKVYDSGDDTVVTLKDEMSDNISIARRKGSNELIFEGDNFKIFEGSIDKEGKFTPSREIKDNLKDIFKYDTATKAFTIAIPDKNKHYQISYITYIKDGTTTGAKISNTLSLFENGSETEIYKPSFNKEVTMQSSATTRGFEMIKVIKKSGRDGSLLANAEFKLTKDGSSLYKIVTTNAIGVVNFGKLVPGDYTLVETKQPEGYKENNTEYKFKVSDLEVGMKVDFIGSYSNAVTNNNELIITNEPIEQPSYPGGGGGGGIVPPQENPNKPVEPGKPGESGKPVEPGKPAEPGKPSKPNKPGVPAKPSNPSKPSNPTKPVNPTNPTNPTTPTNPDTPAQTVPSYPINNTPNPNDPNSPEQIEVIGDDGNPLGNFAKKQKPNGEYEYVSVDDGTPLGSIKAAGLPKTGGANLVWYYVIGGGLILVAVILFVIRKKKDDK